MLIHKENAYSLTQEIVAARSDEDRALNISSESVAHSNFARTELEIIKLQNALSSPYFGHIFYLDNRDELREIFIGFEEIIEARIISWHAKLAALFYSYEEGDNFEIIVGDSVVEGTVLEKRKINIINGELISVTSGDRAERRLENGSIIKEQASSQRSSLPNLHQLLSREQFSAITDYDDSAIAITAPAGSGKTAVCIYRLQYLIKNGRINPDSVTIVVPHRELEELYKSVLAEFNLTLRTAVIELSASGESTDRSELEVHARSEIKLKIAPTTQVLIVDEIQSYPLEVISELSYLQAEQIILIGDPSQGVYNDFTKRLELFSCRRTINLNGSHRYTRQLARFLNLYRNDALEISNSSDGPLPEIVIGKTPALLSAVRNIIKTGNDYKFIDLSKSSLATESDCEDGYGITEIKAHLLENYLGLEFENLVVLLDSPVKKADLYVALSRCYGSLKVLATDNFLHIDANHPFARWRDA